MIWLRRTLAVLLILLFIPLFVAALLLTRVNGTVLSADFYVGQLRKADVFHFLYQDALPAAFDELGQDNKDLPVDPAVFEETITSSLQRTLPPEWLEEQTESAVKQLVPYFVGDRDQFTVTVPLADRIEALGTTLKEEITSRATYDLLLDEAMAPALKKEFPDGIELTLGMAVQTTDLVEAVRQVLPPEWVNAETTHVVDQLVPYATGTSEHFSIQLPLSDRIEALTPVVEQLLVKVAVYQLVSRPEFAQALDRQLRDFGDLPFGVTLTTDQIVSAINQVLPPQWLQERTESILDEMIPYLTGREPHFEVVIPLKDRIEAATPVVKELLRNVDAYNLLFDQVVKTFVGGTLQQAELPLGVTVTADEIVATLRQALPPDFVQQQAEQMLDGVVPYLTGERNGFRIVVPLADRKKAVAGALEDLAFRKLQERLDSLSPCTFDQARQLAAEGISNVLPSCRPVAYSLDEILRNLGIVAPGITADQLAQQTGLDISLLTGGLTTERLRVEFNAALGQQVGQFITDALPNDFTFTDADLRKILGQQNEDLLDRALDWIRNGFTYTDTDLRKDLGQQNEDLLDRVLTWGQQGLTYTDADLRKHVLKLGGQNAVDGLDQALEWTRQGFTFTNADLQERLGDSAQQVDQVRQIIGQFRTFSFLLYLIPALLLAAVGFLGGRSWPGRLAWAGAPLLLASGLAFVAFGPVYQAVAKPALDSAFADATRNATSALERLLAEKGVSIAQTAINDFVGGLARTALLLLVVGLVAVGTSIWLGRRSRQAKALPAPPAAGG